MITKMAACLFELAIVFPEKRFVQDDLHLCIVDP